MFKPSNLLGDLPFLWLPFSFDRIIVEAVQVLTVVSAIRTNWIKLFLTIFSPQSLVTQKSIPRMTSNIEFIDFEN